MSEQLYHILEQEFQQINHESLHGVNVQIIDGNILKWKIIIPGPFNTSYEDGRFPMIMEFSKNYPENSPKLKFLCQMYHPNISEDGTVNLGDFEGAWKQSPSVMGIILYIISLLSDPNCDYAENMDAALTWKTNQREFYRKVKRTVDQSYKFY